MLSAPKEGEGWGGGAGGCGVEGGELEGYVEEKKGIVCFWKGVGEVGLKAAGSWWWRVGG